VAAKFKELIFESVS